jgi:hypothetical protein
MWSLYFFLLCLQKEEILKCIIFLFSKETRGKIKTRQKKEMNFGSPANRRESLTKPQKEDQNKLTIASKNLIKKNKKYFEEKESYTEIKPKLKTDMTETRARSKKPLRSVTPNREEDDYLF